MKKIIACVVAVLLVASLAACNVDYSEALVGTWVCRVVDTDENKNVLMENMELYEEEIALVDTTLYTAKTVTFNADMTYSFSEDVQGVKDYLKEFYEGMFQDLYEGRLSLSKCYEVDISLLPEEEFYQFYADLYMAEDYDALITKLVDNTYDYENFKITEQGSYKVSSKMISFDAEGTENDGNVTYSVKDGKLTIEYSDATEVYSPLN